MGLRAVRRRVTSVTSSTPPATRTSRPPSCAAVSERGRGKPSGCFSAAMAVDSGSAFEQAWAVRGRFFGFRPAGEQSPAVTFGTTSEPPLDGRVAASPDDLLACPGGGPAGFAAQVAWRKLYVVQKKK